MVVERIANNQILISFSSGGDIFGVQHLIDYAKYLDATANSRVKQTDIDELANEVTANWWDKNKYRFLQ
jgi:hypothetical protein